MSAPTTGSGPTNETIAGPAALSEPVGDREPVGDGGRVGDSERVGDSGLPAPDAPALPGIDMQPPGWHGVSRNPYNPHCWILGEPTIGAGTWIGAFSVLDASGGLSIGAGCDIGCGVQIYTHSTARRCASGRAYDKVDRSPVRVGDRVFLAPQVMIMPGVTVGDGAVIMAGAVVTADVPAGTIMAGVPARRVGTVRVQGSDVRFLFDEATSA